MGANPAFLKAYKSIVEKPGDSENSAKFDRCVAHVEQSGNAKNAYAVCEAAMKKTALKSMSSEHPDFLKEVDQFLHKLGIAGAGPVPVSLMSRQDLEERAAISKSRKMKISKDGSSSFSVWYHDSEGNRKCEVYQSLIEAEASEKRFKEMDYKNVYIISSQDEMTTTKSGDKSWVIRCNGTEWGRYTKKSDAEESLSYLTNQGTYAVLIVESVIEGAEKGAVETTGKQLDRAVEAAKYDNSSAEDLVGRMKSIQLKRQKATIKERSKESAGKSFKDVWGGLGGYK